MKKPFITVIGNVGSGKTTFSKWLAKKLNGKFIAADELYKTNPFFNDAVVDRARWSLASDIWFLVHRAEMVRSVEVTQQSSAVVQDSGLPMSWVYANSRLSQGYMTESEANLYNQLYTTLAGTTTSEDLLIYLDFSIPTILKRIKQRGREFEMKHHSEEYLYGLQSSLQRYVKLQQQAGKKILRLSETQMVTFLRDTQSKEQILSAIRSHINI